MRKTHISRVLGVATIGVVTALLAGGCSSAASSGTTGSGGLEKPDIVVGSLAAIGTAGLYVAQEDGLFAKQGLHVTIKTVTDPTTLVPDAVHGSVDVLNAQWTTFIAANESGVGPFRAIANGQALGPNSHEILTLPSSKIKSPAQLAGKTIGIVSLNGIDSILVSEVLAGYGVSHMQLHFVPIPFPEMGAALVHHEVDAVEPAEPWVTQIEEQDGAVALADIDQGSVANLPIAGYAATSQWVAKYPKTAAAFTRAMQQAQAIAATQRLTLDHALSEGAHIDAKMASLVSVGSFPVNLDSVQLQRVASLMFNYGEIKKPYNVKALIG